MRAVINEPESEINVQDNFEGSDYDREKGRAKVSVKKQFQISFSQNLILALELKFAHLQREVKKIVDEINADIRSYSKSYSIL